MKKLIIILMINCAFCFNCSRLITINPAVDRDFTDFEIAWKTVDCVYPYLEYKQIDWDSIYEKYRAKAVAARSDQGALMLANMLGELEDQHIYIKTKNGKTILPYQLPRIVRHKSTFNLRVVRKYFSNKFQSACNGKIKYGMSSQDVGYIYISTFEPRNLSKEFADVMKYMKGTAGLIIDIRNNQGGLQNNAYRIVSWFIDSSLQAPDYYVLGKIQAMSAIQPGGRYQYLNPVIVLINGASYSVSDLFAELMKQLPQVTVVGDTTGGGSAFSDLRAPGNFRLPGGDIIHIGTMDYRRYDGLPWEGIGVPPDIRVPQTKHDIKNRKDKQLEFAIKFFSKGVYAAKLSPNHSRVF